MSINLALKHIFFIIIVSTFILILLFFSSISTSFFSLENLNVLIYRTCLLSILVCGVSNILSLGRIDFSVGVCVFFLASLLKTLDSAGNWPTILSLIFVLFLCLFISLWHYYWIDVKKMPSTFITGITMCLLLSLSSLFKPYSSFFPTNEFFYSLAFAPISHISIYLLISGFLSGFFLVYYLRVASRSQNNLTSDHWIPFILIVITLASLLIAGLVKVHQIMNFRLIVVFAILSTSFFWGIERFFRLGRRISVISCHSETAYLLGIPVLQVRRELWIIMGILIFVVSLFYREVQVPKNSFEAFSFEAILLSSSFLGNIGQYKNNKRYRRLLRSLKSVVILVILENILLHFQFSREAILWLSCGIIFVAIQFSPYQKNPIR